jgi:hemoglobin
MDLDPEYAVIRALHPPTLDSARDKLYCFLSGWMGGPPLYVEKYGNPMLRARHLPFAIGSQERDQWLACMDRAMRDLGLAEPLRQSLYNAFHSTADWMRNKPGDLPEAITRLHGG